MSGEVGLRQLPRILRNMQVQVQRAAITQIRYLVVHNTVRPYEMELDSSAGVFPGRSSIPDRKYGNWKLRFHRRGSLFSKTFVAVFIVVPGNVQFSSVFHQF